MKTRKTLQTNEENEGPPTGDTKTHFKCPPKGSVGSIEVGTIDSNVEETGSEL